MRNPFLLDKEEYKRDIDLVKHYITQASQYLSINTGKSIEQCEEFVKNQIKPGGKFEFKDPIIHYTLRDNFEDRVEASSGTLEFIKESLNNKELIAPTFTTYVHPDVKESILVEFIDENVANRSKAKKKMFAASMEVEKYKRKAEKAKKENDLENYEKFKELIHLNEAVKKIQNTIQANNKISNNSLSGAQVSASTPIFNKSAHSSLTSTCRLTSGLGNANNEKFIAGNRHYHSFEVVVNNITSIVTNTDYVGLAALLKRWDIVEPTVQQTMECIRYSSELYWRESSKYNELEEYVSKLTGLQRAAFVYTGDFYHLRKFNDGLVRKFLFKLSKKIVGHHPDPVSVLKNSKEEIQHLAVQICDTEMKGVSTKEAFSTVKNEEDEDILDNVGQPILAFPDKANTMALTIENIQNTLIEYSDLIKVLWASKNFPASVAYFPDSIRRVVLVSDTDSTIFTVQEWIQWFFGKIDHSEKALGMCASVVFLASQTIGHLLAMMSANLGIIEKRINQIQMKNEYRFDILVPTTVAKHYYASIGYREGNLYSKYDPEIKGVHLKSSNAPKQIIENAHDLMINGIMLEVIKGNKLSLDKIIKGVANIERDIIESTRKGNFEYLRLAQIKESESYVLDDSQSPFQHYTLWNEVFGPKYGLIPPPPYTAIKVSTVLNSRRKMEEWLVSLEDKELVVRMRKWLEANGKKNGLGTFQLPDTILSSKGIPDEIYKAMDVRRIVIDATSIFYHILETLGVYMLDKPRSKLFYDYY